MKCLKQQDKEIWAHVICVNWTPEISFKDENKSQLEGKVNLDRYSLKANTGSIIQCDFRNCKVSYNVREAVDRGMIFQWSEMEKQLGGENYDFTKESYIPVFCECHRDIGYYHFRNSGFAGLKTKHEKQ